MGTKICRSCSIERPSEDFSPYAGSSDGLFSYCRKCNSAKARSFYAKLSPEERAARNKRCRSATATARSRAKAMQKYREDPQYRENFRNRQNARAYGLTPEKYAELRLQPCGICGKYEPPGKRGSGMHIDHDHKTKVIRGVLCSKCNRGLGSFDDDPGRLAAAAQWLEGRRNRTG